MGTILASAIVAAARVTLLDPAPGTTWSDPALLGMLNQAQRNACALRGELFTVHGPIVMAVGTLQSLPAGGTALIRLHENVAGGRRCRLVDSGMLDAGSIVWPAETAAAVVQEYTTDAREPKRFQVWPPNTGTGSVIALYCAVPTSIAALANAITLDDTTELALQHFVVGEAYAANTKRQDLTKATFYRQSFEKQLGLNAQTTVATAAKYGATPGAA